MNTNFATTVSVSPKEQITRYIQQRLTLAEQYDLTHRPLVALHLALRYAENARTYAWSDKVAYTKKYNNELRELFSSAKPKGMEIPEWTQFRDQADIFADNIADVSFRLHLVCKQVVSKKYADNLDLRAWALASLVALRSMRQLEERYEKMLYEKTGLRARMRDSRAKALHRIMVAYAGEGFKSPALNPYQNELTNNLLSIEFVSNANQS